jgi:methyl-accepting chemotaxis protein
VYVEQTFTYIVIIQGAAAQYVKELAQHMEQLAQYITELAHHMEQLAQYIRELAQHMEQLAQI